MVAPITYSKRVPIQSTLYVYLKNKMFLFFLSSPFKTIQAINSLFSPLECTCVQENLYFTYTNYITCADKHTVSFQHCIVCTNW